ncbi:MAG: hypothetical protein MZU97_12440 [Bacillus subtilis]|nr:hypothetical protein [Bacillus subtilis]
MVVTGKQGRLLAPRLRIPPRRRGRSPRTSAPHAPGETHALPGDIDHPAPGSPGGVPPLPGGRRPLPPRRGLPVASVHLHPRLHPRAPQRTPAGRRSLSLPAPGLEIPDRRLHGFFRHPDLGIPEESGRQSVP